MNTSPSRLALVCGVATLAVVAACGGASSIDLLSNTDAGAGSSEAGASSSSGSSGALGDGGTRTDGATTVDGGTQPGGDTTSLPCGASSCSLATEVCCLTASGGQGGQNSTFGCLASATCPRPGGGGPQQDENDSVTLRCTATANCATGTVCCVSRQEDAVVARCAASCTRDEAQLCDPSAATTGCSAAEPCSSENIRDWRLPRTFATCGGRGD